MKLFGIQEKGTNFLAEMLAGLTTFVTMSYLLFQCPAIMATGGISEATAYISVCLTAFAGCLTIGLMANQPIALAPSIGMTAFFTSVLLTEMKYTLSQALALTLLAALMFLVMSVTGIQNAISAALPSGLKNGVSAGLGIYIALLGLKNAGFLSGGAGGQWNLLNFSNHNMALFTTTVMFIGLLLITASKRFALPCPILVGVLGSGAVYYIWGVSSGKVSSSDLHPNFGSLNEQISDWFSDALFKNFSEGLMGIFKGLHFDLHTLSTLAVIVIICSLFNSMESTCVLYAVGRNTDQLDEAATKKSLIANAVATIVSSCFGSPMPSAAPESCAGISAEGKTGLTAVTTGALFLISAMFTPFVGIFPSVATAAAMVYIGVSMVSAAKDIGFEDHTEGIPALVAMIVIPFTSSVIDGIVIAVMVHIALNVVSLKLKAVKPAELAVGALLVFHYFWL